MAQSAENAPLSDTETGGEKPVREQLRKARIGKDAISAANSTEDAEAVTSGQNLAAAQPSLRHKRSHEEIEGEEKAGRPSTDSTTHHRRKRSRDTTPEEDELNNGQRKTSGERPRRAEDTADAPDQANGKRSAEMKRQGTPDPSTEGTTEAIASPKTKRSRLHSTAVDEKDAKPVSEAESESTAMTSREKQSAIEGKDSASSAIPTTSGFANASAASPFSSLAGTKTASTVSDVPQTSAGAFASSGFGSLAGSTSSGFGAVGKSAGGFGSGGSFASGSKSPVKAADSASENEKPAENATGSAFGGALGQKSAFAAAAPTLGFGSGATGFGKLGGGMGGFGGALAGGSPFGGGGGGLANFASGKPSPALATVGKPARPFGAPPEEGEDDGSGDDVDNQGFKSPQHALNHEDDKQDERFYEQPIETGEEEENTGFSCRSKLYAFHTLEDGKREWQERGLGTLRLNVKDPEKSEDGKLHARFLMRADGSHRVVLNTPVKKELNFGSADGGEPKGGYFFFMGTIDGKTGIELLQLKMRQQFAEELYAKIREIKELM